MMQPIFAAPAHGTHPADHDAGDKGDPEEHFDVEGGGQGAKGAAEQEIAQKPDLAEDHDEETNDGSAAAGTGAIGLLICHEDTSFCIKMSTFFAV